MLLEKRMLRVDIEFFIDSQGVILDEVGFQFSICVSLHRFPWDFYADLNTYWALIWLRTQLTMLLCVYTYHQQASGLGL